VNFGLFLPASTIGKRHHADDASRGEGQTQSRPKRSTSLRTKLAPVAAALSKDVNGRTEYRDFCIVAYLENSQHHSPQFLHRFCAINAPRRAILQTSKRRCVRNHGKER